MESMNAELVDLLRIFNKVVLEMVEITTELSFLEGSQSKSSDFPKKRKHKTDDNHWNVKESLRLLKTEQVYQQPFPLHTIYKTDDNDLKVKEY